ncbi:MAG TPA: magnesium transporter CorA family protein [Anaerolineae bacterium]|nr:magnesium transporter CorA family protein [Anaerolineae bacterium]
MIRILCRSAQGAAMTELEPEQLADALKVKRNLIWVDLSGEATETYQPLLIDTFGFHPLAVEDALIETHLPKIDDWDEYLYLVLYAVDFDRPKLEIDSHEVDVFLGPNYLVTHHTEHVNAIERLRSICLRDARRLQRGADYLLFELADTIIADFMPCLDALDEVANDLEDEVFNEPSKGTLPRIFTLKRAAIQLRRILSPQREVLNRLARDEYRVVDAKERIYFRGIYDHLVRLHDINEGLRDLIGGALDIYLSAVSNRLNEVMRILTLVTVLGLPLTFFTGFFGMNFFGATYEVPAPLDGRLLFLIAIGLMIITPLVLYVLLTQYVQRKKL